MCEDLSPSDILDSDCWAKRYTMLSDQYPVLQGIGFSVAETKIFLEKLEPIIPLIVVPSFQATLPNTIDAALGELNAAKAAATASVSSMVNGSLARTVAMNQSEVITANTATTQLQNFITPAMQGVQEKLIGNLNQLIRRANTYNDAASSFTAIQDLASNMISVTPRIADHNNKIGSERITPLSAQRIAFDNALFSQNAAFVASLSAATTGASLNANTRASAMLQSVRQSIVNYLNNPAYIGARAAQTNSEVTQAAASWTATRPAKSPQLAAAATALFPRLFANITTLLTLANTTDASVGLQLTQLASAAQSVSQQLYVLAASNISSISNWATLTLTQPVTSWDSQAQTTIATLQGYVNAAKEYMNQKALGGSTQGTNAVMDRVLASMSAVGSIQASIEAELLRRQTASMDMANALISQLQANGASFQSVLQSIQFAISALSTAGNKIDPNLGMFGFLRPRLDSLAVAITDISSNLTSNLSTATLGIDSNQTIHQNWVRGVWQNETERGNNAAVRASALPRIAAAAAAVTQQTSSWTNAAKAMFDSESSAEALGATTLDSLTDVQSQVQVIIDQLVVALTAAQSNILTDHAQRLQGLQPTIDLYMNTFSSEVEQLATQTADAVNSVRDGTLKAIEDTKTARLASMDSQRMALADSLDQRVSAPVGVLNSASQSATPWALDVVDTLNRTARSGFTVVPQVLSDEENKATSEKLTPLGLAVDTTLSNAFLPESQVIQPSSALKTSLTSSLSALALTNATLTSLGASIRETDKALLLWGSSASQQITNLLGRASTIDSILKAEADVLYKAIWAAFGALDISSRSKVINAWMPAALSTLGQASNSLLSNATDQFNALRTRLQAVQMAYVTPPSANLQNSVKALLVDPTIASLQKSVDAFAVSQQAGAVHVTGAESGLDTSLTGKLVDMMKKFAGNSESAASDGVSDALGLLQRGLSTSESETQAQRAVALSVNAVTQAGAAVTSAVSASELISSTLADEATARANSFGSLINEIGASSAGIQGPLLDALRIVHSSTTDLADAAATGASLDVFAASVQNDLALLGAARQSQQAKQIETTDLIRDERAFIYANLLSEMNTMSGKQTDANAGFRTIGALLVGYDEDLLDHESWMRKLVDAIDTDLAGFANIETSEFSLTNITDTASSLTAADNTVNSELSATLADVDALLAMLT